MIGQIPKTKTYPHLHPKKGLLRRRGKNRPFLSLLLEKSNGSKKSLEAHDKTW